MKLNLTVTDPFSLTAVIRSHGWAQLAPFATDGDYRHLTYVDELAGGRVLPLTIEADHGGVVVTLPDDVNQAEQAEVRRKVGWMLGLDRDLSTFYAVAQSEPKLQAMIAGRRGRILRSPTLFEDTVKTILTTNTAWSGTIRMVRALVDQFGSPWPEDADRRAFPPPAALAAASVDTLRQEAKLGYRAPFVLELAQRVVSGDLDLAGLQTAVMPTPQLRQELLQIKGVGSYAAANLLMLLGRTDFIPIDSYGMKMVSHEFYGGQPIGPAEVEAAFEHWGEWKGMAFWFWDWAYDADG